MPTLAATIAPVRNVHPRDSLYDQNWVITLTEPVPDGCVLRIGEPPYSEPVRVEKCTGSGPYVVKLVNRISKAHPAGTPVTVLDNT